MTVGCRISHERERFLFAAVFSRSVGRGCSVAVFVHVSAAYPGSREGGC